MWGVSVRRKVVWVCILALFFTATTSVLANNEIDQHRNEAKEVKENIDETKGRLDEVKTEQSKVAQQLEEINKDIKNKEEELVNIEKKLNDTLALLEETKAELADATKESEDFEELMARRLCAMYMMEGTSYLELLFEAKSLNDFLDRLEMVKFMVTYDNQVFDKMVELQNVIQGKKEDLEAQEEAIKETKADISKQKSLIETKKQERLQVMEKLKEEQQEYERDLEVLEQTSKDLETTIQRLVKEQEEKRRQEEQRKREEEQRRKEDEQRKKEEQSRGQGQKGQSNDAQKGEGNKTDTSQGEGEKSSGTFTWPVPGHNHISSGYGNRWHPVSGKYKFHTGIDISGGGINGKNAVAASGGTVILAEWHGGYGNTVIIDHGGGITTVYAHGSQILVSVGQTVDKGQAVLKIGSTGISTGPHLHFEVRKNGGHVNPMPYLGR